MELIEPKIGEILQFDNKLFVCEELNSDYACEGCYFINIDECTLPNSSITCIGSIRNDRKEVIFRYLNNVSSEKEDN